MLKKSAKNIQAFDKANLIRLLDVLEEMKREIESLQSTTTTLAASTTSGNLSVHLANLSNPHQVTLRQLGLLVNTANLNLLNLSGLVAGWVLSADDANSASWKKLSHTLLSNIGSKSHVQIDTFMTPTTIEDLYFANSASAFAKGQITMDNSGNIVVDNEGNLVWGN